MTQTELDALIQEIDRAKKAGGKNVTAKINISNGKEYAITLNEDGSWPGKRKPSVVGDSLVFVEKQTEVGDNRTATNYEQTFRNVARIVPLDLIADTFVEYDVVVSTPLPSEPEQPEE